MIGIRRILAQSRPAGTAAASLFSQGYDDRVEIDTLHICNVTGSSVNVSVFHDADGTTFDQTTAIIYQYPLAANGWIDIDELVGEWTADASIGIQVSVADAATFTLYGRAEAEGNVGVLQLGEGVI